MGACVATWCRPVVQDRYSTAQPARCSGTGPIPSQPGRGTGTTHALGHARPLWRVPGLHPQGEGEFLGVGRTKAERVVILIFSRVLRETVMPGSQQYRLRLPLPLAQQVQSMA
jgi:hypothetical protein